MSLGAPLEDELDELVVLLLELELVVLLEELVDDPPFPPSPPLEAVLLSPQAPIKAAMPSPVVNIPQKTKLDFIDCLRSPKGKKEPAKTPYFRERHTRQSHLSINEYRRGAPIDCRAKQLWLSAIRQGG